MIDHKFIKKSLHRLMTEQQTIKTEIEQVRGKTVINIAEVQKLKSRETQLQRQINHMSSPPDLIA